MVETVPAGRFIANPASGMALSTVSSLPLPDDNWLRNASEPSAIAIDSPSNGLLVQRIDTAAPA